MGIKWQWIVGTGFPFLVERNWKSEHPMSAHNEFGSAHKDFNIYRIVYNGFLDIKW
jgi:hypothetical protein